jgi:hypothetical protein
VPALQCEMVDILQKLDDGVNFEKFSPQVRTPACFLFLKSFVRSFRCCALSLQELIVPMLGGTSLCMHCVFVLILRLHACHNIKYSFSRIFLVAPFMLCLLFRTQTAHAASDAPEDESCCCSIS